MQVKVDKNLETKHKGLFVIGDCSGVTHSLSHASASGVYVARHITEKSIIQHKSGSNDSTFFSLTAQLITLELIIMMV